MRFFARTSIQSWATHRKTRKSTSWATALAILLSIMMPGSTSYAADPDNGERRFSKAISQVRARLFSESPRPVFPRWHGIAAVEGDLDSRGLALGARALRLQLPGGVAADLDLTDLDRRGSGDVAWRGRVARDDDSSVSLTLKHGLVYGRLRLREKIYEIRSRRNGRLVIEELNLASFPQCDVGPDHIDHRNHTRRAGDVLGGGAQSGAASAGDGAVVVDLLSVYSNDALAEAGSVAQMEATIQAAVDAANTAFVNSNINATYRLVHVAHVDYDTAGSTSDDLRWVTDDPGVAALREQYGADMVSIIVDTPSSCGTAWVQRNPGPGFEDYAFQATDIDCAVGNLTFAHEHGHNLGMEHNPENSSASSSSASYPWSFAHYVNGSYRTVMSYSSPCSNGCSRVAQFSNPDVVYNGVPTGVEGSRDNAQTGSLTTPIAANFRATVIPNGGTGTVVARVSTGNDDVEERHSDGVVDLNSSDIELGNDPGYNGDQTIGLRFNNLNIPQGATVLSAYLEFTVDETDSETTGVIIRAEAADNALAFLSSANNVTDRVLTSASTAWGIPAWGSVGTIVQSPDISSVVQEVVDRGGWAANNSMVFVIEGTGQRTAEAFEGVPAAAALLHVEYDMEMANQAPTASFDYSTTDQTADFTDTSSDSDGSIVSRSWDFGDGNGSSAQNPSHTYASAGTYTVTLTVTDDEGAPDSASQSVTVAVSNQAPTASFNHYTVNQTANFTDTSSDSDGTITSRSWDFGDNNSSTAQNPSHDYGSAGTYTVTLTVTDNDGAADSTSQSVTVTAPNQAPTASFSFTTSELTANFTDGSSDSDGSVVSRSWDFGDGNGSTSQDPSHTYASAGTYTVVLTVTDNEGAADIASQSVTVTASNQAPVANAGPDQTVPDSDGADGESVELDGSGSSDSDGTIESYSWTWDGGSASGVKPTVNLPDGTTVVTLTVTDDTGASDSDTVSITSEAPLPGEVETTFVSIAAEDGWVRESNENSGVGGKSNGGSSGSKSLRAGDDKKDRQYKFIVSFDTSSIPNGATILSARLELTRGGNTGTNPFTTHGPLYVDVNSGSIGGNAALQKSDFEAPASGVQVTSVLNQGGSGSVYTVDLSGALAHINDVGRTQLRMHFENDDNDDNGNDYGGFYSSNNSNSGRHPRLIVTYQEIGS